MQTGVAQLNVTTLATLTWLSSLTIRSEDDRTDQPTIAVTTILGPRSWPIDPVLAAELRAMRR